MDITGFKSKDGTVHKYDYNALANKPAIPAGSGEEGSQCDVFSQTLRIAMYNLLMDAVYQSSGHAADKNALAELLSGGTAEPEEPDEPIVPEEPDEPVEPDIPDEPVVEKTLVRILAVYSGGTVFAGTNVSALTGIVVTGYYSDETTEVVTGYTLSGTIAEGSNTVTVSYQGKTTTFTVLGMAEPVVDTRTLLYHWDFTGADPLVDLVSGAEAQVNSGSPDFDSDGLRFKSETDGVKLLQSVETFANQDIEIDIGNISGLGNAAKHLRLLTFNTAHSAGLISRNTTLCWSFYSAAWTDGTTPQNSVSNKTIKLSFDNADKCTAYLDGEEIIASTAFTVQNMMLGSNSNSAKGIIVKALRIYQREE